MQPRRKKRLDPNTVVIMKQIFRGCLVLLGAAVLVTAIWHGTRVQVLTIDTVSVSGGKTIKHSLVEELAQKELEGEYFGLIPKRFAWLYPEKSIHESLRDVERIHDISINRVNGKEIKITFDEYVSRALWCESVESDNCVFLDEEGFAFAPAPKLTGGSFLRFVQIGQTPELQKNISAVESYNDLFLLTELLAEQSWFVSHIELDTVGDAFLSLVDGGELKIALSQSPEETLDNFLTVISSEDFSHVEPGNFQYIDLRFGKKVFVNEELADPEEETASSTESSSE